MSKVEFQVVALLITVGAYWIGWAIGRYTAKKDPQVMWLVFHWIKSFFYPEPLTPHWLSPNEIVYLGKAQHRSPLDSNIFQYCDRYWYFWDDTGVDCFGPYKTEEEAQKELLRHSDWLGELNHLDGENEWSQ